MQGNSLLETYEGIKLFDEKLLETKTISKRQELIEQTQKKVNVSQKTYLGLLDEGRLKGIEKVLIDKELKENKELLKKILKAEEPAVNYGLFNGEPNASSTKAIRR